MYQFNEFADVPHESVDLPEYQSHKQVQAIKIDQVQTHSQEKRSALITPLGNYPRFVTESGWLDRFKPEGGDAGYFVRYADGYTSWSPSKAFEEGYSLVLEED